MRQKGKTEADKMRVSVLWVRVRPHIDSRSKDKALTKPSLHVYQSERRVEKNSERSQTVFLRSSSLSSWLCLLLFVPHVSLVLAFFWRGGRPTQVERERQSRLRAHRQIDETQTRNIKTKRAQTETDRQTDKDWKDNRKRPTDRNIRDRQTDRQVNRQRDAERTVEEGTMEFSTKHLLREQRSNNIEMHKTRPSDHKTRQHTFTFMRSTI